MKKYKLLSRPANLEYIQLDELDYNAAPIQQDKALRAQFRRWRKLRQQAI